MNGFVDQRLQGRNLICFGVSDWCLPKMPVHHLMALFATTVRVHYVEGPLASLVSEDKNYWSRKLFGWLHKPRQIARNLLVYRAPPGFPLKRRFRGLNKLTQAFTFAMVARQMRSSDITDPMIWFTWPTHADLLDYFPKNFKIYHVADEVCEVPYGKVSVANEMDSEITRAVDLLIATSSPIFQRRRHLAQSIHLIPNGIDFQLFGNESNGKREIPSDLVGLPRPIVGFSGAIDRRFDFPLMRHLAERRRDCSFVLNGPLHSRLKSLLDLDNIHYLGMKPVEALPGYIAAYDVCLIPYKINKYTMALSPLKLWEYLAMGKPVVSTPIPACLEYAEWIYLADSSYEFSEALAKALKENSVERRRARIALAKENTWQDRSARISRIMADLLENRGK